VQLLDLPDICNLRSGSRQLAFKSTQTHFKSFFNRRRVYLNQRSLDKFVQATDVSKLCCRIEHLVLVGLVDAAPFLEVGISTDGSRHDQPPQDIPKATGSRRYAVRGSQKSNRNLALLSKALRNISISGNTKYRLPRLSLETEINLRGTQRYRRHDLRFWGSNNFHRLELEHDDVAARSFHFVMEALAMSRLTIEKLAIYYTNERLGLYEVNGIRPYGLYSTELIGIEARYPGLKACLASTTSLYISLCQQRPSRSCPGDQSSVREPPSSQETKAVLNVHTGKDSPGLGHLLRLTENLEDLDLQYYGGARCTLDMRRHDHRLPMRFFKSTATSKFLPRLPLCRLRGLDCYHDDLLLFLQRTRPRHIVLQSIKLASGSWPRIFEHITGSQTGIERVLLSELREAGARTVPMWFPEAPAQPYYSAVGGIGDSNLELRDEAVRNPINCRFMPRTEYDNFRLRASLWAHKRACVADPCPVCLKYNL
jgi:hypothetical protein